MRSVIDLLWEDGKEKTPHPRLCRPIPGIVVTDKVEKHPFIRYAILDCKVIIILIIDSDKGNGVEIDTVDYFFKRTGDRRTSPDLLFQCVKFRRGEKLRKGNVQTIADFFDRQNFWVSASAVENVLNGRRR